MTKVKSKKSVGKTEGSFANLFRVVYDYKLFEKKQFSTSSMAYFSLMFYVLVCVLGFLSNLLRVPASARMPLDTYLLNVGLILPLIMLFAYSLFYAFLNSYDIERKSYFKSLFAFTAIFMPFIFLMNLFNYVGQLSGDLILMFIFILLIVAVLIYMMVVFIVQYRSYYEISAFKVLTAMIMNYIVMIVLGFVLYLISIMG